MAATYRYLTHKPSSVNRQLYVRDRWVAARTLYGALFGEEARTPEEIAADYALPLEAVLEAIAWCESDPQELRDDFAAEEALDRTMSARAEAEVPSASVQELSRQSRP